MGPLAACWSLEWALPEARTRISRFLPAARIDLNQIAPYALCPRYVRRTPCMGTVPVLRRFGRGKPQGVGAETSHFSLSNLKVHFWDLFHLKMHAKSICRKSEQQIPRRDSSIMETRIKLTQSIGRPHLLSSYSLNSSCITDIKCPAKKRF